MTELRVPGITLIAAVIAATAMGTPALGADVRLQKLAEFYSGVRVASVSAESTSLIDGHRLAFKGTVSSDGSFGMENYNEAYGNRNGKEWNALPSYFVYYEDGVLRVADGTGSEFQNHPIPNLAGEVPGPVQWLACPWPVIPQMCRWLEEASDLIVTENDGILTATSASAGMSLTWQGSTVRRVLRGDEQAGQYQAMEFGSFGQGGQEPWVPGTAHETLRSGIVRDGEEIVQDVQYRISVQSNGSTQAVRFDAARLEVNRYDEASGNVFAPDGTVTYNKHDVEAAMNNEGFWSSIRGYGLVGVGLVVLVAVVIGLRKAKK